MAAKDPLFCQGAGAVYDADEMRQMLEGIVGAFGGVGVAGPASLLVTENGTPDLSVNIAAGGLFVDGSVSAHQGIYWAYFDAVTNIPIATADPSNPRIDLIVVQVRDNASDGSGANDARIMRVAGTPAGSPAPPALPTNCYKLAEVLVDALAASILQEDITDSRQALPFNLVVRGSLTVAVNATVTDQASAARVRATSVADASATSTQHAFQAGATTGPNVIADGNEIMARNNGALATLFVNADGGDIKLGAAGATVDVDGTITVNKVRVEAAGDATLGGEGHGFQVGDTDGLNVIADGNEIMARNDGVAEALHLNDEGGEVHLGLDGTLIVAADGAGNTTRLTATHDLPAAAGTDVVITAGRQIVKKPSSRRYKENIVPLAFDVPNVEQIVLNLDPAAFEFRNKDLAPGRKLGFIAEDVAALVPQAAIFDLERQPDAVDTTALLAVLWEHVQALTVEVAQLRADAEEREELGG